MQLFLQNMLYFVTVQNSENRRILNEENKTLFQLYTSARAVSIIEGAKSVTRRGKVELFSNEFSRTTVVAALVTCPTSSTRYSSRCVCGISALWRP